MSETSPDRATPTPRVPEPTCAARPASSWTPTRSPAPAPGWRTRSWRPTAGAEDLVLLGIPTRGVTSPTGSPRRWPRWRGSTIPTGSLDITMYRDDLRRHPDPRRRPHPAADLGSTTRSWCWSTTCSYSGRTVRAALDALGDLGRPRAVRLAVLVDRGHRQLPIRADHVGKNLPTAAGERVRVRLAEVDGVNDVTISRRRERPGQDPTPSSTSTEIPPDAPPAVRRRPQPGRDHRDPRPGRGDVGRPGPAGQEAARPARPDGGQPVLRGLHPDPVLVRDRRQVAVGGCDQHSAPRARRCPRASRCGTRC